MFAYRENESHRMVRRMKTVEEMSLSYHKSKSMKIEVRESRWRATEGDRRKLRIKREMLRDEGK